MDIKSIDDACDVALKESGNIPIAVEVGSDFLDKIGHSNVLTPKSPGLGSGYRCHGTLWTGRGYQLTLATLDNTPASMFRVLT